MTDNHIEPPIVIAKDPDLNENAQDLAKKLGLLFYENAPSHAKYALVVGAHYLSIQNIHDKKAKPFYIDFLSGKLRFRWQQAGFKKELLARAIGAKPKDAPHIVDATAGLGRDGFVLAALGYKVTMLERSPVIYALLNDALLRAAQDIQTADIAERIHLVHIDATLWLKNQDPAPKIIYLDPMFPPREKSAQVKKEMVILQEILGKDIESNELFNAAIACAGKRVVVKRSRLAPTITEKVPNFALKGTSSRFDIYLV